MRNNRLTVKSQTPPPDRCFWAYKQNRNIHDWRLNFASTLVGGFWRELGDVFPGRYCAHSDSTEATQMAVLGPGLSTSFLGNEGV